MNLFGQLARAKPQLLTKLKKQLDAASKTIESTGIRTRAMERKLRSVEELPTDRAQSILKLASGEEEDATSTPEEAIDTPSEPPAL